MADDPSATAAGSGGDAARAEVSAATPPPCVVTRSSRRNSVLPRNAPRFAPARSTRTSASRAPGFRRDSCARRWAWGPGSETGEGSI
jgi:hypothetical protein